MQNQKKTKGMAASKYDIFNAHWPTNLINNAEAKEKRKHVCINKKNRYAD